MFFQNTPFTCSQNQSNSKAGSWGKQGTGNWKGTKIGLFNYNEKEVVGKAMFNWLHYVYDGTKQE